jgi:hypothetical protein
MQKLGKLIGKVAERVCVSICYRSVGLEVPTEIKHAMKTGQPFNVNVSKGKLTATINGIPLQ